MQWVPPLEVAKLEPGDLDVDRSTSRDLVPDPSARELDFEPASRPRAASVPRQASRRIASIRSEMRRRVEIDRLIASRRR